MLTKEINRDNILVKTKHDLRRKQNDSKRVLGFTEN